MQPKGRAVKFGAQFLVNLDYSYVHPTNSGNNGDVFGIDNLLNTSENFDYTYDWLNRIKTATMGGSVLTYYYDRYGNRLKQCGTSTFNPYSAWLTISSSTNRITAARLGTNACNTTPTQSYTHDSAGDLTNTGAATYEYDGASRIKTVNGGTTATYTYDGDGRRAKKVAGGATRYYFYDPEGNPVWEYQAGVGWDVFNLFFNGRNLAANTISGLFWRHLDHLGTPKDETNNTGQLVRHYVPLPFGESMTTLPVSDKYFFTSKERDAETGLDYFGARYHGSPIGRFTSPDESLIDQFPEDPQSWNLFSYVRNNPLTSVDPTGRECVKLDDGSTGDDGQGEVCASAGLDQEVAASATVVEYGPMPLNTSAQFVFDQVYRTAGFATKLSFWAEYGGAALVGGTIVAGGMAVLGGNTLTSLGIGGLSAAAHPRFQLLVGQALTRVRPMTTGRLAGYLRGNSELSGGLQRAREVFQQLTGRAPNGIYDRAVKGTAEVVFRETGASGHAKIDYVNHIQKTFEHITFK